MALLALARRSKKRGSGGTRGSKDDQRLTAKERKAAKAGERRKGGRVEEGKAGALLRALMLMSSAEDVPSPERAELVQACKGGKRHGRGYEGVQGVSEVVKRPVSGRRGLARVLGTPGWNGLSFSRGGRGRREWQKWKGSSRSYKGKRGLFLASFSL